MDGIDPFVRREAASSGGLAMHGAMRALIARWVALIAMLGLLELVIATQSHTMRALWAAAYLTNALQVKTLCNAECFYPQAARLIDTDRSLFLKIGDSRHLTFAQ
jgi:hypothetical protein